MPRAAIALGSNLPSVFGSKDETLHEATLAIHRLPSTRVVARSAFHSTDPVGFLDQPQFLNAAVIVETSLTPHELLGTLLGIEAAFGRDREHTLRDGPRTLDLDLLTYDDLILSEPSLTLPHPRLHERAFVLVPLAEIAPDLRIPGRNASVRECLAALHT